MKSSESSRVIETIPAVLAWTTLIGMVVASKFVPVWAAIFIIVFDTYWFFKTVFLSIHLRFAFKEMKENRKIDWLKKVEELDKDWDKLYHLVVFPMSTETYNVVKETFQSMVKMNYPKDRMIVVLGYEDRIKGSGKIAKSMEREFGSEFFKFLVTCHPSDIPGEIIGKGANETWATKRAKEEIIDKLEIPYEDIIISVFDIDTQIYPDYFGRLTYCFLTTEYPQRSSYQPIPLFNNNIYEAPAMARVVAFSATFWHGLQQARAEKMTTFSSHSMPFKALVEIGFWETGIISEDSRIFWQLYLHYDGDWRVVPLLYPVSMDANVVPTFWGTMKNVYKQQLRWAWGIENVPYIFSGFKKNSKIAFRKKLYWMFEKIEGFHSWATNAVLIFALGWLPIILGGEAFNDTVLSFNLPNITRIIMTFASIGIISSAVLSMALLPPKPEWFKAKHNLFYIIQWALLPLSMIILGAIPAIEAQTRLALGGKFRLDHRGFWITPKGRKGKDFAKDESHHSK